MNTTSKKIMAAALALLTAAGSHAQCIDGNCDDGYGVYLYSNGERYEGFWNNGKHNGFGAYTMPTGDTYVGQFLDGAYNGRGTYSWADNGNKYIGHWQNGDRQGIGTYILSDGRVVTGIFMNDEMIDDDQKVDGCINGDCQNGFGVAIYDNGAVYEGFWGNGYPNTQGKMTEPDGSVYEGEFLNGYYNGFGIRTTPDGLTKCGLWEEDRFVSEVNPETMKGDISGNTTNGYGIYVFESGDYYMGYWKNDKMNGQGTIFRTDGTQMQGCWENNQLNGFGIITYGEESESTLAKYIGDLRNGELNGYGCMIWKDNSIYYGQLKNGQPNGQGVLIDTEKGSVKQQGVWENNKLITEMDENDFDLIYGSKDGFGIKLTIDGRYAGQLKNGIPNGQGTLRCHTGFTAVSNNFVNGTINGYGMMECPDGRRYVGEMAGATAEGQGTLYFSDGTSVSGIFHDGNLIDEGQSFDEAVAKPQASWVNPDTETTDQKTTVELCVASGAQIEEIILYVNGEVKSKKVNPRNPKFKNAKCDYNFKFEVELNPGANEIYATVKNKGGISSSEKINITLQKSDKISESKRLALIIGNSEYANITPLANPQNDANLMGDILQKLDFETMVFTNLGKDDMIKKIREFGSRLSETKAVGLFFYAGHGLQVDGDNYLVPVNAEIAKKQDVEFECVNLKRLLGEIEYAGNDLNIIILDACRNNPFANMRAINDGGLAAVNAPKGTFIAFATAPGSVAADGGSTGNGLYTSQLAKHISQPNSTIEEVFKKTRTDVYNISNKEQVPWENSSIFGDFYFKKQ